MGHEVMVTASSAVSPQLAHRGQSRDAAAALCCSPSAAGQGLEKGEGETKAGHAAAPLLSQHFSASTKARDSSF